MPVSLVLSHPAVHPQTQVCTPQKLTVIIEGAQNEIEERLKELKEMIEKAKKGKLMKKAEEEQDEMEIGY